MITAGAYFGALAAAVPTWLSGSRCWCETVELHVHNGPMTSSTQRASARAGRLSGQQRTALMSIGAAAALVALKLGTGLATGSLGLISAGIESSGDVVAAVLTFVAIRVGAR